jgi:hypothetical protein
VGRALKGHEDAFEPVGHLDRDGVEDHAASLLEVRELADLKAVEPHLPTESPGAKSR